MQSVQEIAEYIKSNKTIALLAPSFPVDFEYPKIVKQLRAIGFDKVVELTYAAKLINHEYHELLASDENKQVICTNCPTVTQYIARKFPQHKDKLANIASPMVIMGRIAKNLFGDDYSTVFIGPCFAKKMEASSSEHVDHVLTFKELQEIFDQAGDQHLDDFDGTFDKFYNDYTKIYPLSGAVVETMHYKKILENHQYVVADGIQEIDAAIAKMESDPNIRFVDALACDGGCIGGKGIMCDCSTEEKTSRINAYKDASKLEKLSENMGKICDAPEIDFENEFLKNM